MSDLLVGLIEKDFTVVGHGRFLKTEEHSSLVIDTEKGLFYWNSKGIVGDAFVWLTQVKGCSYADAKKLLHDSRHALDVCPSIRHIVRGNNDIYVYSKLVDIFYENGISNREYWLDYRGYTDETISRFKLGYSGYWYTIPIFVDGKFVNFQCRRNNPKTVMPWYKGMGSLPFNFDLLAVLRDFVIVTEGPPDAIMCRQHNLPAVSQTAGATSFKNIWLPKFNYIKTVYIVYNKDGAGDAGAAKLARKLGHKARIYNFWESKKKGYDITDFFKDGNSKEDFMDLLINKSKSWEEVDNGSQEGVGSLF